MDSTPTSHRPRRGRKALEKCSSTPIRAILKDSASDRTSPSVSPMDRANTSWLTPSTGIAMGFRIFIVLDIMIKNPGKSPFEYCNYF